MDVDKLHREAEELQRYADLDGAEPGELLERHRAQPLADGARDLVGFVEPIEVVIVVVGIGSGGVVIIIIERGWLLLHYSPRGRPTLMHEGSKLATITYFLSVSESGFDME